MSKTILVLVRFLSISVAVYLAFAFIAWEIDPSEWTTGWRAIFVTMNCLFGGLAATIAVEQGEMK